MISRLLSSRFTFLFIFILYAIGLWHYSVPLTGDQKVYLSIALEMKERASFLIPWLDETVNFLKPPFQYWMTLLGWKVFGFNLFGALVPSLLALLASAWWVKRILPSSSFLPALFFAGTLGTLTYGTTAQMEIWIVLFYLAAWGLWLENRAFSSFLVVGVMSIIKGPLYPVLWVMSVILHSILRKEMKKLLTPRFLGSLAFGMTMGLAWYVLAWREHPAEIMAVFFQKENLGKMQTSQGSIAGLWSEFTFSLFPILGLVILGFFDSSFRKHFSEHRAFFISYGLIPALFFTFFPYRVNTYLYLLTPLAVWMIPERFEVPILVKRIVASVSGIIALFLIFLLFRLEGGGWIGLELGIPLILVLALWSYGYFRLDPKWVGVTSILLVNLVRMGAVEIGEWDLKGLREAMEKDSKPISYLIEHEDIWHEFGLVSTAVGRDLGRLTTPEEASRFLASGGTLILSEDSTFPMTDLHCTDWTRIKRRIKFPVKALLLQGLSIEDPELHRVLHLCSRGG